MAVGTDVVSSYSFDEVLELLLVARLLALTQSRHDKDGSDVQLLESRKTLMVRRYTRCT